MNLWPRIALACAFLALHGCGTESVEAPSCNPAMPSEASVRAQPAFASLKHYKRVNYTSMSPVAYDIWGDSRYDYRVALQFSLQPGRDGQPCATEVALHMALPADGAQQRAMVEALVRTAAPAAGLDGARLLSQLEDIRARGGKYRRVIDHRTASVSAGTVSAPTRGDFYVVAFAWPSP